MIFGVDISNHKTHFDFPACRVEGYDFAFLKCSQNDNFVDVLYPQHNANARAAGMLVLPYHYQGTAPARSQVALINALVEPGTPVILDVEDDSGDVDITRELVNLLGAAGHPVPLVYIPRWYWSRIGWPDLTGLPPLWISRYPDYTVRRKDAALSAALQLTGGNLFAGHGGLSAPVAQITSSGAVADYPNGSIDLNVYDGTRDQLAALIGGDSDMALTPEDADLVANTLLGKIINVVQTHPVTGAADGTREVNIRGILEYADVRSQLAVLVSKNAGKTTVDAVNSGLAALGSTLTAAIRAIPSGPGGGVSVAEVEAVIRRVFGGLADTDAQS